MVTALKFFKRNWLILLSLFIVVVLSYGQTLGMYFWVDDNALIYKLQHINQDIGFWGEGAIGTGPYRHIINQFVLFYPIFKTNPTPYYAVGILLYFFASASVYFFVKSLTNNKYISLGSGLIFAAGYIGAESVYGITNSWQTSRGIIMTLFTFWLFLKFARTKQIIFYLLSIPMFFFSLDTVYVRAPGLIFTIFLFDLLFWPVVAKPKSIVGFILRQLPFLSIHYHIYLSSLAYAEGFGILHLIQDVFIQKKFQLLAIVPQDIGNLFIPNSLTSFINTAVSRTINLPEGIIIGSLISSVLFFLFLIFLIIRNYRKEVFLTKVLVFGVIWMVFNFIVFYGKEPGFTLRTTHRYFHYSLVGVSLFWSSAFYLLLNQLKTKKLRKIFYVCILLIVSTFVISNIVNEYKFNQKRSFPARKLFSSFDKVVPNIPKGGTIYFDLANDPKMRNEFTSFFGGMFSEGANFAINSENTDYMKDFKFTYKFDDILTRLATNQTTLDKVFTFYYGENGLVNTTSQIRGLLQKGETWDIEPNNMSSSTGFKVIGDTFTTRTQVDFNKGIYFGHNPQITIEATQAASYVPGKISFNLMVRPMPIDTPYQTEENPSNINLDTKNRILAYLLAQDLYKKTAVATSASFWKQEIPSNAVDGRLETVWRGHRGFWHEYFMGRSNRPEFFSVDLGKEINVGAIRWTVYQKSMLPTHYKIFVSRDGSSWQMVKEEVRIQPLPESTVVSEIFDAKIARFVKMEVYKTYSNEGPAFREFEVVEKGFENLNSELVEQVRNNPFARITDSEQMNEAFAFIMQTAKLRFYWMSDSEKKQDPTKYIDLPLLVDGIYHEYSINLPAAGMNWTKFTLTGFNFPVELNIRDTKIMYTSLKNN